LNTQNNHPVSEQSTEQREGSEPTLARAAEKKQFVEPVVSVPVDVLEATTFFQTPTIEAAVIS
jgi:hypothetical protein